MTYGYDKNFDPKPLQRPSEAPDDVEPFVRHGHPPPRPMRRPTEAPPKPPARRPNPSDDEFGRHLRDVMRLYARLLQRLK